MRPFSRQQSTSRTPMQNQQWLIRGPPSTSGCCGFAVLLVAPASFVQFNRFFEMLPAIDTKVAVLETIVRSIEEQTGSSHSLKVRRGIIDQIIDIENRFFSTEDDAMRWNLRCVTGQPAHFVTE